MEYVIAGPTITNDIVYADGRAVKRCLGGSVFCVGGIKLWTDSCLYVSNVGADFDRYYGEWMRRNNLSERGINRILPYTHYNVLRYGPDGLHSEASVYGEAYEAETFPADRLQAEQIAAVCGPATKGIYIEAYEHENIWEDIDMIRKNRGTKIMWEIPTSAALDPDRRERVLATLSKIDIFSLNLPEAKSLFAAAGEAEAAEKIKEFGRPCFFRVGTRGSYWIDRSEIWFAPSVAGGETVDATGCGNCATAAALYGYCEGYEPLRTAVLANVAAAYNLRQYGPIPPVTKELRAAARAWAERIYSDLREAGS